MSDPRPPKREKKNARRHKNREGEEEEGVWRWRAAEAMEEPAQLGQVNFLSISNLEVGVEDYLTHQPYYEVIMENQHNFAGKAVLHITEGINCLYSVFAARAGASKVYCVISDKGERETKNVFMMREVVKENRLEGVIEVLLWKDFNAQVEVIIGEPMGYCLHFDGLLGLMLEARDRFLVKGGMIFPNSLSFKCAAIHDEFFSDQRVDYWDDVYGVPMRSMKKWISHEPQIRAVDPALIVSKPARVLTLNLEEASASQAREMDSEFSVELLGPCSANGLVFWFEASFGHSCERKEIKGTPWLESTKFTQVTLYWPAVRTFARGGAVRARVRGERREAARFTVLWSEVAGETYEYSFS